MLDYEPSELRELYHRLYPETTWDGRCVVCGHDFFTYCQGNCTCLSCNLERQSFERDRSEREGRTTVTPRPLPSCDICLEDERRNTPAPYRGWVAGRRWCFLCEAHKGVAVPSSVKKA